MIKREGKKKGASLKKNITDVNLSVSEVAREAGFQDPLYFSRQFRRRFGASPREHRRRQQPPD